MTSHIDTLRKTLLEEKALIESELAQVGRRNPENPSQWEATVSDLNTLEADQNERADQMENYSEHNAIETELARQLNEIDAALERIANQTFGTCEVGGEKIEDDRLAANPAARTCKKHLDAV